MTIHQISDPYPYYLFFQKFLKNPYKDYFTSFSKKKGFFNSRQFGFRPGHSTEDALASLSLFINRALDSGLLPAAILIDIKKAFDRHGSYNLTGKVATYWSEGDSPSMV